MKNIRINMREKVKISPNIYPLFTKISILICNLFAFIQDNLSGPVFSS